MGALLEDPISVIVMVCDVPLKQFELQENKAILKNRSTVLSSDTYIINVLGYFHYANISSQS